MPCRPSGTGVFMFDGESVCMSSAQGDDASHSADARMLWCAAKSGEVATTRFPASSDRRAHAEFGGASIGHTSGPACAAAAVQRV